jgi:hypothetical protein
MYVYAALVCVQYYIMYSTRKIIGHTYTQHRYVYNITVYYAKEELLVIHIRRIRMGTVSYFNGQEELYVCTRKITGYTYKQHRYLYSLYMYKKNY